MGEDTRTDVRDFAERAISRWIKATEGRYFDQHPIERVVNDLTLLIAFVRVEATREKARSRAGAPRADREDGSHD